MSLRDHRAAAAAHDWRRAQLQATAEARDGRRTTWLQREAKRQERKRDKQTEHTRGKRR